MSHATSVGNKRKQTEDRKYLLMSNIVSIVSSPSRKAHQNEVHDIKEFIQYSMSNTHHLGGKDSKKRVHFISQVHNTEVKWSVKPCFANFFV